jgi:hypothetical protein
MSRLEEMLNVVCDALGVDAATVQDPTDRKRMHSDARCIFSWVAKRDKYRGVDVARFLNQDRACITQYNQKYKNRMECEDEFFTRKVKDVDERIGEWLKKSITN